MWIWRAIEQKHSRPCRFFWIMKWRDHSGSGRRGYGDRCSGNGHIDTYSAGISRCFGNIEWTDEDRVKKQIADLPSIVRQDEKYQNAMKLSDEQNARAESDRATNDAILATMSSGIELYKAINQNDSLRRWILNMVFNETYQPRKTSPKSNRKVVTHTGVPEDRTLMVAEDTPVYGKE